MTQTFLIGSAVLVAMVPVLIPGTGVYSLDAQRNALDIARKLKGIEMPVVINERTDAALLRQQAIAIRKWAAEEAVRLVRATPMNGSSPMCFDDRYEPYQFD